MEGITYKKKEIFFAKKLDLFTFGTITLLKLKILGVAIFGVEVDTKDLTFNFPHFEGHISINITHACIKVQE
jgi:hypothetical protein